MRKKEVQKLYRLDPQLDLRGRVKEIPVYIGGYYDFKDERFSSGKVTARLLFSAALSVFLFIASALPDPSGLRQFYIAMPYVFLFLPYLYSAIAAFSMVPVKDTMDEVKYSDIVLRTEKSAMGIRVLLIMSLIGQLIYFVAGRGSYQLWQEIYLLVFNVLSLLVNEARFRYILIVKERLTYRKQEESIDVQ